MTERIIQKIEHIRTLPEHIRLRYALGAVAICMIFIIAIWILTIKQAFNTITPEVGERKEQTDESLSNMNHSLPITDSLETLKENSESLRVNNPTDDADEFLNQELERKKESPATTMPPSNQ